MTNNVGGIDRVARIAVGLALIALAVKGSVGMWGYLGLIPLVTGLFGLCPVYSLLGIRTCPLSKR